MELYRFVFSRNSISFLQRTYCNKLLTKMGVQFLLSKEMVCLRVMCLSRPIKTQMHVGYFENYSSLWSLLNNGMYDIEVTLIKRLILKNTYCLFNESRQLLFTLLRPSPYRLRTSVRITNMQSKGASRRISYLTKMITG